MKFRYSINHLFIFLSNTLLSSLYLPLTSWVIDEKLLPKKKTYFFSQYYLFNHQKKYFPGYRFFSSPIKRLKWAFLEGQYWQGNVEQKAIEVEKGRGSYFMTSLLAFPVSKKRFAKKLKKEIRIRTIQFL